LSISNSLKYSIKKPPSGGFFFCELQSN